MKYTIIYSYKQLPLTCSIMLFNKELPYYINTNKHKQLYIKTWAIAEKIAEKKNPVTLEFISVSGFLLTHALDARFLLFCDICQVIKQFTIIANII